VENGASAEGKLDRDDQATVGAAADTEAPVMRLGDAAHDRQAKADPTVVTSYAVRSALERLGQNGDPRSG